MRELGVAADSRPSAVTNNAEIDELRAARMDGPTSYQAPLQSYAAVQAHLYTRIEATNGDLVTQDILIALAHLIDEHEWFLRARAGGITNGR